MTIDYLLLIFTLTAIPHAEIYLFVMKKINENMETWKRELIRLLTALIFIGLVFSACIYLGDLSHYSHNYHFLKASTFLPFFNFGAYLMMNYNRTSKILGPQIKEEV